MLTFMVPVNREARMVKRLFSAVVDRWYGLCASLHRKIGLFVCWPGASRSTGCGHGIARWVRAIWPAHRHGVNPVGCVQLKCDLCVVELVTGLDEIAATASAHRLEIAYSPRSLSRYCFEGANGTSMGLLSATFAGTAFFGAKGSICPENRGVGWPFDGEFIGHDQPERWSFWPQLL